MAKQCSECGSITPNDQTPYCEACGGRIWRDPKTHQLNILRVISIVIMIAALAGVFWLYLRR